MSRVEELTCQELVELVTEYLDGALPDDDRARMDAHLDACPGCRAYLAQMEATLRVLQGTPALEERPEVAKLLGAFRDWKQRSP